MGKFWTSQEIEALKALVSLGNSASFIGKRLGRTRNAIIGQAHRLNLNWPKKDRPPAPPKKKKTTKKMFNIGIRAAIAKTTFKPIERVEPPPENKIKNPKAPCYLREIGPEQCRSIIGDPRNGVCCGLPSKRGSYCREHARKYYQDYTRPQNSAVEKSFPLR